MAWTGTTLFEVWATFVLLALPFDIGSLLGRLAGLGRLGLGRESILTLAVVAGAMAVLGLWSVHAGPVVRKVTVPIRGLPKGLDGLRIVQISDLHIGPTIRGGYVERVVRRMQELRPDLIAVTGDLADGGVGQLAGHVRPLKGLSAPLGVYYVTGNHEYYWGADQWIRLAVELGFIPLIDENRVVARNGAKILVGGVADSAASFFAPAHRSDPNRAAASEEETGLKLILAHRPDRCEEAEPAGFDLHLSGHTHGGQFFPFSLLIRLFPRHCRGLSRHGRMWVHVNPGTGYWGPPHRFGVPAEITLLRIVAA